jgi:CHAT domain-containing protein/Tfp pilus assembly protein PilF
MLPTGNCGARALACARQVRDNPRALILAVLAVFLLLSVAPLSWSQNQSPAPPGEARNSGLLKPGIVIEKFFDAAAGAQMAGMEPGDILLRWSRGSASGKLDTTFDFDYASVGEMLLGRVEFEGVRGTETRRWKMPKIYFGALVRPNFGEPFVSLYHEGLVLADAGKPREACKLWDTAALQAQDSLPAWVSAWFFMQEAGTLEQSQLWSEADATYQRAATQSARAGIDIEAMVLRMWGVSYYSRSDWKHADEKLSQAVLKSRQAQQRYLTAVTYNTLAYAARGNGDMDKAEKYALESFAINFAADPDSISTGSDYMHLGIIAYKRGDFIQAEEFNNKALASYLKMAPKSLGTAYLLNNLGELAQARGDLTKAESYFRQTMTALQRLSPGGRDLATITTNMAYLLDLKGDSQQASELFLQALEIMHKAAPDGSEEEADIRDAQGDQARRRGDMLAARQFYLRALTYREKIAPTDQLASSTLNNLGEANAALGEFNVAEGYFRRALAIREKLAPGSVSHAETLAGLANVKRRSNQLPAASQYYEQALAALESQTARFGGSSDLRAIFRAQHADYYREYVDLLVSQNEVAKAFEVLERSRARTLLEILTAGHIDLHRGADPALLQRERSLLADVQAKSARRISLLSGKHTDSEVAALEKEISRLTSDYGEVEAQIVATSPAYAALTQPQPLSAEAVKKEIRDPNTVLLEYSLGEERSHVFAVSADSIHVFTLPPRAEVEKQARRVYELLTERNRSAPNESPAQKEQRWSKAERAYTAAADELSRTVLGPVAAQLSAQGPAQPRGQTNVKRLVIVADGALHYIPFAALPTPDSATAQPLATSHEVVSLPSASVVALLRQQAAGRKPAPRAVAILADPVFSTDDSRVAASARSVSRPTAAVAESQKPTAPHAAPSSSLSADLLTRSAVDLGLERGGQLTLSRLGYTRMEGDAIKAVTPRGLALEAVDFQASRATAISPELANYRIVHFATHGLLNSQHPELSGLVFSLVDKNGGAQEGFLTLQDIYNLNLPADLVVLSACETGLGKEVSGEGLMGLTRGFMHAGATRVVASLWKVSDVATAHLMEEFYRAMEKDGLSPAAALRAAQVKMLKQPRWSNPYYWAAFQIQGEWK